MRKRRTGGEAFTRGWYAISKFLYHLEHGFSRQTPFADTTATLDVYHVCSRTSTITKSCDSLDSILKME
jgi:hypothetical protein